MNPVSTKASCPAASNNTLELTRGEMTPATKADNMVMVKDWQDATVPRMCGKRSNTNSVSPGATIDMPIVYRNSGATVQGNAGGKNR